MIGHLGDLQFPSDRDYADVTLEGFRHVDAAPGTVRARRAG